MNIDPRKKAKSNFGKDFFKLMNNLVCGNRKKNYFMSDPNYHTNFHRTFLSNRNEEKTDILRRKPGHLFRLSIPELSKILMC